mgnify:CR=1 FL=1
MRVLITGGSGFIAAWIAKRLISRGVQRRLFDVTESRHAMRSIAGDETSAKAEWLEGDIARLDDVQAAAADCDAIIHLAGVLTPACKADPTRGAEINLIGTLNVF